MDSKVRLPSACLFLLSSVGCFWPSASATMSSGEPELMADVDCQGSQCCAVSAAGLVSCWGVEEPAGTNIGMCRAPERRVFPEPALSVSATSDHVCIVAESGRVYCSGDNAYGQLGVKSAPGVDSYGPQLPARARQVAVDIGQSCAVLEGGLVRCWGAVPQAGKLVHSPLPVALGAAGAPFVGGARKVALNGSVRCVLDGSGTLWCWGDHDGYGRRGLAYNDHPAAPGLPVRVPTPALLDFALGSDHACGLAAGAALYCWGRDPYPYPGTCLWGNCLLPPRKVSANVTRMAVGGGDANCRERTNGLWTCVGSEQNAAINAFSETHGKGLKDLALTDTALCAIEASGHLLCSGAYSPACSVEAFVRLPEPVAGDRATPNAR